MKEQHIGKVKLNLSFYSGSDQYSDGDEIESHMLALAQEQKSAEEILSGDNRWPVLYHFSPIRENILNWYSFKKGASVLEIGSGCGAVTGALCRGMEVNCVELSKRRASISAHRHQKKDNIEIYVANFNDVKFNKTYDYITLIGVLEYAKHYTSTSSPYVDFLCQVKRLLKSDGKLFIAIENRYGLKYWAGANEDHTGMMFEGLYGYKNSNVAKTFSKKELTGILNEAGFTNLLFYYPYPDYKMPHAIYSDNNLPKAYELILNYLNFDMERVSLFDEQRVYEGLIENGMYDFFANSFLVVAE